MRVNNQYILDHIISEYLWYITYLTKYITPGISLSPVKSVIPLCSSTDTAIASCLPFFLGKEAQINLVSVTHSTVLSLFAIESWYGGHMNFCAGCPIRMREGQGQMKVGGGWAIPYA